MKFEKNGDSSSGKIIGDSTSFRFQFHSNADNFEDTPEEFFASDSWKNQFIHDALESDKTTDTPEYTLTYLKHDTSEGQYVGYTATIMEDSNLWMDWVFIDPDLRLLNFLVDTIDHQYRKIVYSKDPGKGITGIYIKDLRYSKTNASLALSMSTDKSTKYQQALALKIFGTGRHKNFPH
jgi:hypothetical protein